MIAPVNMAVDPYIVANLNRRAQVSLRDDVYMFSLTCRNASHGLMFSNVLPTRIIQLRRIILEHIFYIKNELGGKKVTSVERAGDA